MLLFFNTAYSQTKEQIGQWLSDSLMIETYFNIKYSRIAHEIETSFYLDYNLQKDKFTLFFTETSTHKSNLEKTISVKIVQIYSKDIIYQDINGLQLVKLESPYKQSTPVYGIYRLLLREGANVNIYENNTLKDITEMPNIQEIFKPGSYYSKNYRVVSEKVSNDKDEPMSCLKINASGYFNTSYLDLLNQFDFCVEKNGNSSEACRDIANKIDEVFIKLPNILIKNDETYVTQVGNALYWMFEFCKL